MVAGVAALAGCHRQPSPDANQEMSLDENVAASPVPGNAEIETLPPDESSTTPSNQLQKGYDNPDVNDLANGD